MVAVCFSSPLSKESRGYDECSMYVPQKVQIADCIIVPIEDVPVISDSAARNRHLSLPSVRYNLIVKSQNLSKTSWHEAVSYTHLTLPTNREV